MALDAESRGTVVVGGGLAGLAAATLLARAGRSVALYERTSTIGGRAATHEEKGFRLNLGPHALYRGGAAMCVLRTLGIRRVAVMGAVTEMCVAATACDAVAAGWPAVVLRGASVSLAGTGEEDALASLGREGIDIVGDPEPWATA